MLMIMRLVRFLLGIMLVPVCVAATYTVVLLVQSIQPGSERMIPASTIALGGGFLVWLFLYFTMPRPVRTYVLAHELTHALWAFLTNVRVLGMKVSKERGSVTLASNNFLITLAPYFFPFYTVLVVIGYYITSVFVEVESYYQFWLALVGFTWGFHFTFTIGTLMQRQTDIQEYGHLFSYAVIYSMNAFGICLWIVLVSSATLEEMVDFMASSGIRAILLVRALWEMISSNFSINP